MKLDDQYPHNWFLKCRKIADDSLNSLAILRGGARGGASPFPGVQLPPLPPPLATPFVPKADHVKQIYTVCTSDIDLEIVFRVRK